MGAGISVGAGNGLATGVGSGTAAGVGARTAGGVGAGVSIERSGFNGRSFCLAGVTAMN